MSPSPTQTPDRHGYNLQFSMNAMITRLLVLSLCLAPTAWSQQTPKPSDPQPPQQESEPTTTLKVDVNLVNVFVTVTDAKGAPVAGLTKDNFALQEDGKD